MSNDVVERRRTIGSSRGRLRYLRSIECLLAGMVKEQLWLYIMQ